MAGVSVFTYRGDVETGYQQINYGGRREPVSVCEASD